MTHPSRHRFATILLSAAYALATATGGLHDHGHAPGAAKCQHRHGDHAADGGWSAHEHESDDILSLDSPMSDGDALHDDDCTVCRAAGQRVLVVEPCQLGHLSEMCVELAILQASQPSATFARTHHSALLPSWAKRRRQVLKRDFQKRLRTLIPFQRN